MVLTWFHLLVWTLLTVSCFLRLVPGTDAAADLIALAAVPVYLIFIATLVFVKLRYVPINRSKPQGHASTPGICMFWLVKLAYLLLSQFPAVLGQPHLAVRSLLLTLRLLRRYLASSDYGFPRIRHELIGQQAQAQVLSTSATAACLSGGS